ncbi:MAG: hypothetical protein WCP55_03415 [Lentisphaerota bacterium]
MRFKEPASDSFFRYGKKKITKRNDNLPLIRFQEEAQKWLIVQPVPVLIKQVAESEDKRLSKYAENFTQWYRHSELITENILSISPICLMGSGS